MNRKCTLPSCGVSVPPLKQGHLCAGHVMALAMVCYGKVRRNRSACGKAVRERSTAGEQVKQYECPVCSLWHIGHYDPAREGGTARAFEVVRELRAAGAGWLVGSLADDWHPSRAHRDPGKIWRKELST